MRSTLQETGYRDIQKFLAKIAKSEFAAKPKRLIFISRRGFTAQALEYAKDEKVVLLTEKDISKISHKMNSE